MIDTLFAETIGSATLAALTEPWGTAVILSVLGVLMAVSVLISRTTDWLGVPVVLLFMVLGMLGGSEGPGGLAFDDYSLAVRLGTIALVLILLDGGLNTSLISFRSVLLPAGLLATVGVLLTAALLAMFGWCIGLSWGQAALLGAVVSSTDAAAVLAVLRGGRLNLHHRVGKTIEVESCINDPMAVILTIAVIEFLTSGKSGGGWIVMDIGMQLLIGAAVGAALGWAGRVLLGRIRLSTVGLYPVLILALAFVSFGGATLLGGSGFLSVFLTAMLLGAGKLPYHANLARVIDALAWLSQVGMFLMLGLLVFPSHLTGVAWMGLGLALFLGLVARPLAVAGLLAPLGYSRREIGYVGWVGLRGAVPIILGTLPVLAGVDGAERIFNIVFFIVVVSSIAPGAMIRPMTRWMKVGTPSKPVPSAVIELSSEQRLNAEILSFHVEPSLVVCGATLSQLTLPEGAAVMMIVREKSILAARGHTQLQQGDHVYIFCQQADRALVELLFGQPEA